MASMDFAGDSAPTDATSATIAVILALEGRLDAAMRAGNAAALDELLAEDLMFTGNHCQRVSKADDLALHRRATWSSSRCGLRTARSAL